MIEYRLSWPTYTPFPYERSLAVSELEALTGGQAIATPLGVSLTTPSPVADEVLRRLAFTSKITEGGRELLTDIHRLEQSGLSVRHDLPKVLRKKESNYLTHGLHRYKGKFYPQLVRSLLNIANLRPGALVLDPFMGSGTTLVEASLTGLDALGFDVNPLAHLIASTKLRSLRAGHSVIARSIEGFERALVQESTTLGITTTHKRTIPRSHSASTSRALATACGQPDAELELSSWFPTAVQHKLIAVVRAIGRLSSSIGRDFVRVCLSDLLRGFSQQEPRDLRIRRRDTPIADAPVFSSLSEKLWLEAGKLHAAADLLSREGCRPNVLRAELRDVRTVVPARHPLLRRREVDAVVTSPPYATALPYVDTDRLSYLILGLASPSQRNLLQRTLIGTREIADAKRRSIESGLRSGALLTDLPSSIATDIRSVQTTNDSHDVGFRRRNMAALLYQYFMDMRTSMRNVGLMARKGSLAFIVLGDSETTLGDHSRFTIRTCDHVATLCEESGYCIRERIPITVTTEDRAHVKNAITDNQILVLQRR